MPSFASPFAKSPCDATQYYYQTLETPDPMGGAPVFSILLLSYIDDVAIDSKILYDVSHNPAHANALCKLLADEAVFPEDAAEILEEWLAPEFETWPLPTTNA